MSDERASARSSKADLVEMAAEIASAYVRNNSVPLGDMPALIATVHGALSGR